MSHKHSVFSQAKNLKSYITKRKNSFSTENLNHAGSSSSQSSNKKSYVYITDHLPKEFLDQKKKLLPDIKDARSADKKTAWKIENGNYNL